MSFVNWNIIWIIISRNNKIWVTDRCVRASILAEADYFTIVLLYLSLNKSDPFYSKTSHPVDFSQDFMLESGYRRSFLQLMTENSMRTIWRHKILTYTYWITGFGVKWFSLMQQKMKLKRTDQFSIFDVSWDFRSVDAGHLGLRLKSIYFSKLVW